MASSLSYSCCWCGVNSCNSSRCCNFSNMRVRVSVAGFVGTLNCFCMVCYLSMVCCWLCCRVIKAQVDILATVNMLERKATKCSACTHVHIFASIVSVRWIVAQYAASDCQVECLLRCYGYSPPKKSEE